MKIRDRGARSPGRAAFANGTASEEARAVPKPGSSGDYARTGTLAVRSSLPQLTQAPLIARRIAFQTQ